MINLEFSYRLYTINYSIGRTHIGVRALVVRIYGARLALIPNTGIHSATVVASSRQVSLL